MNKINKLMNSNNRYYIQINKFKNMKKKKIN